MAVDPIDPIEEEMDLVLSDPDVRASLEEFERAEARGELEPGIPHEEIRRMLGLPPRNDA
jgi:hypothetical protein